MKICQKHWDAMRAELSRLRLDHIGARSAAEAAQAIANQFDRGLDADIPNDEWDPLMSMHWNFMSRALEIVGLAAMADDFGCPLCHAREDYDLHSNPGGCGDPACARPQDTSGDPTDENWIRGCAQVMLDEAKRRGLMRTN